MTQPDRTYKIERSCTVCGHVEKLLATKREAAFELLDVNNLLGSECKNCHSKLSITTFERPDLDVELLNEWATNLDLDLMQQDEDLLLADEKYLDIILEIIDTDTALEYKRNLLISALCVIVYDNSNENNSKRDEQLKKRVIKELDQRQDKLKLADKNIMEYIKNLVYPQLEFGRQNAV